MNQSGTYPWHQLDFMSEKPIPIGPRRLNLATGGRDSGTTILFLHGVTRHWRTFFRLLTALRNDFSLAALDFRGHGFSDRAPGAYLVTDFVEDALAAIESISAPRLILYGHSLGAMVAFAAASRTSGRVERIILEDPPFSTMGDRLPSAPLHRYFAGLREVLRNDAGRDADAYYEAFSNMVVGEDPDGSPIRVKDQRDESTRRFAAESFLRLDPALLDPIVAGRWLDGYDLSSLAQHIACPALVFQGDGTQGGMLIDADVRTATGHLGNKCRVIRFDGIGHNILWTRPDETIRHVKAALQC